MMAKLAEVGFTPELHLLHVAPRAVGAARVRRRAHAARRWSSTCGRRSGPTRPTSSTTTSGTRRRAAFALRFVLAATLVPLYGIYSGYELCENEPADDTTTEYRHSEKYEIKARDYTAGTVARAADPHRQRDPARPPRRVVAARHPVPPQRQRAAPRLQPRPRRRRPAARRRQPRPAPRAGDDRAPRPRRRRPARRAATTLHDELTGERYTWEGDAGYVRLDPAAGQVAHLFHVTV